MLPFKDLFSKCDQIRSFLKIWSHILKKPWLENFIFYAVVIANSALIDFKNLWQMLCKFLEADQQGSILKEDQ